MAYTDKQKKDSFSKICKRIVNGEALRTILNRSDMPTTQTFYKWIEEDKNKMQLYARATSIRADKLFDEILELADKQEADVIITKEGKITNHNIINRNRLQIDSRKWILSKLNPKKYGDKLDLSSDDGSLKSEQNINLIYEGKKIDLGEKKDE